jgi:tetratricopeptide (TPR) repeat protein
MAGFARPMLILALAACLTDGPAVAQQRPAAWTTGVAEALRLYGDGRIPDAIEVLRKTKRANPALPAMHVLQLAQYLTEHVMASPQMPRAEAARLLDEARSVTDEVIGRKQEVRMAMMAKSMIVKLQAERVEQNADRRITMVADSERLWDQARFTNADGSPIAKTIDDEWSDAQAKAMTMAADGTMKEDGSVYERFLKAHPDYAPGLVALARFEERQAEAITDRSAKSVAARTRLLEQASAHYRRATETAAQTSDAVSAMDGLISTLETGKLNRPADAEALGRAALKKYPHQPILTLRLLRTLLPSATVAATGDALRGAREIVPATPESRHAYGVYLWELAYRTKDLPRDATRTILSEAVTALDAALKQKPEFIEALVYKAIVLNLQADRVEQDPARIKALRAEADRLREQAKKLQARKNAS